MDTFSFWTSCYPKHIDGHRLLGDVQAIVKHFQLLKTWKGKMRGEDQGLGDT